MFIFNLKIPEIADILVNLSSTFSCSLEDAWESWMPSAIKKQQVTFEEVKNYIDEQVALGKMPNKE